MKAISRPSFASLFARPALRFTLALSTLLVFNPVSGYCGQWRVAPARVFLERDIKSSVITVVNEGDDKVNLQVKAMQWTQDAEGKDVYQETVDLIFFPRMLLIGKGEQKIIRAGLKGTPGANEKTYRLFIEEIPQARTSPSDVAQLTVAVRFGVPVFVKPVKEDAKGELVNLFLSKGSVTATVRNNGNTHFRISDVAIRGKNSQGAETFAAKLEGWYLLNGASRTYTSTIPAGKCAETAQIEIQVATDAKITLKRELNVEKGQCLP